MGFLHSCFFLFLALLLGLVLQVHSQNFTCNQNDFEALQDFLKGLQTNVTGWDSNDCCSWPGVSCTSGRVTKLELPLKRLTGKLGENLGKLDQLTTLNLSHNFLKGSLPLSLFQLPKLEVLDLSSNDFAGPIPQESINLPSLTNLDISSNALNGSLPTHICQNSIGIKVIRLAVNYFSGGLEGLGNCSELEHLCLGMNDLSGGISEDMFQLQRLKLLGVQDNNFSGNLSAGIGRLLSLERLDISSNNFTGEIPDVFQNLSRFWYFVGQSNRFVGNIPKSLANSASLNLLNLRNNSLVGTIDLNCSALVNLTSLDLGSNKFNGSVPSTLPLCRRLKNINLARNNFTGQIPDSFRNFDSLSYLSLSNMTLVNISSALQILQQCKNLTTLVLTLNFHNEVLPSDPSLHFENLKVFVIANCRLTGSVPLWLSNSSKLQLLDVSWNHLRGEIPEWLGGFRGLFYLDLSNNSFTGGIPRSLTGLPSLINRDISLEEPSPDFPFFMKRNVSARVLQYNQVWSFPPTLDLSYNLITGPIWPEFGNLKKLHILDLKNNNLSGPVPGELSGMTSLESLDLSQNNLSGSIPWSFVNLTFLSRFSVAYNQLSGKIPTGGQFMTFPNSSFEGNYLCGDHGTPLCPDPDQTSRNTRKSRRNKDAIVGMAVGIVSGCCFLLALLIVVVLRAHGRGEVDVEKEIDDANEKDLEDIGSRLVVLFQNKENYKDVSMDDLLKSTNNFDQANIVGCGGFGLVYRATLPDGRKVAIKRLSGDCGQMDREFRAEVESLSRAQHPNLVHLQGYCMLKNDRLLIYSYMENSSLDYWLHEKLGGPSCLDWKTRLQIARGAARGLAYLHQSCEPRILHRDIKSSNILLDEKFEAHLADFGLARLIRPYETHVTTDLVGTLGYIPPEYGQASVATYQGDVYSFGVVLLELLTGKRPMDICKPKGTRDLISWVMQMKKENREGEVFDPFIYDKQQDKELHRVLEIACLCLNELPKVRPSTQQLVSWLDSINT